MLIRWGKSGRCEWLLASVAVLCALGLGFANLSVPALWHDELVHVYVGNSIAEGMSPQLLSGELYWNGTTQNLILAGVIKVWGMGEAALRAPSVVFAALNVLLTYWVLRPLLGPVAAIIAAFAMALSPWTVAWSREARFYTLQQGFYLLTIGCAWRVAEAKARRDALWWCAAGTVAYALSVLTSFHSIVFLSGIGLYMLAMLAPKTENRKRWTIAVIALGAIGVVTLASYQLLMNAVDREAVFEHGGLGGELVDPKRALRWYYLHWLWMNHSVGVFVLALGGFAVMCWREGRRGLYAALAFWGPILVLTWLIGYRQPRFMFFAFPFYVAAFAYGLTTAITWLTRPKPTWIHHLAALALAAFLLRLSWSVVLLLGDSIETASGAHTTLERRHPQWKIPCAYVKAHADGAAIVTTEFLPVYHYAGRVDTWYPNRYMPAEKSESGIEGLPDLAAFRAFMAQHPKGFYIAETSRFDFRPLIVFHPDWAAEVDWIKANLRKIDEASTEDVVVYAWGE